MAKKDKYDLSMFESDSTENQYDLSMFQDKKKSTDSGTSGEDGQSDKQILESAIETSYEEGLENVKFDQSVSEEQEPKEVKLDELPKNREEIRQYAEKLDSSFAELKQQYDSAYSAYKDMQQEVVLGMPGEGRYRYDEQGNPIKLSEEEIKERDAKIERLDEEANRIGAFAFNGRDINESTKTLLELSENPEGFKAFGAGFLSGVKNYFKDYGRLINEIGGAKYLDQLQEKVEKANKGEEVEFTEEEKFFIRSTQAHQEAINSLKDKIPMSAEIGQAVGQSIAFMGEFALTAGSGSGILKGAKSLQGFKGLAARSARTVARAGVQTLKMPSFFKETVRGLNDDEQGVVKDVWNSFYDTYWEVLPERIFMGMIGTGKGVTGVDKFLNRAGSALAGKRGVTGVLKGFGEETLEEQISMFMQSVKKEDSFSGVINNMTDLENQMKTIGSVAVITGLMGGATVTAPKVKELANNSMAKYKLKKAGNKLDKETKDYIDAVIEDENTTLENMTEAIKGVASDDAAGTIRDDEASQRRFANVVEYAGWKMRDKAYSKRLDYEKEQAKQQEKQPNQKEAEEPTDEQVEQKVEQKGVQLTETEKGEPAYRIGETQYDTRDSFLEAIEEQKGKTTAEEIEVQNDENTAKRATEILREGIEDTEVQLGEEEKATVSQARILKSEPENTFKRSIQLEGEGIGEVTIEKGENEWSVKRVDIEERQQRKGFGRQTYRELNRQAQQQGVVLRSDRADKINDNAKKLWGSLVESGEARQLEDGRYEMLPEGEITQPKAKERTPIQPIDESVNRPNFEESQEKVDENTKPLLQKAKQVESETLNILADKKLSRQEKVKRAREALDVFVRQNSKDISKISGRAVPAMLRKVNNIKSEVSYNKALNYINKYITDEKFRRQENERYENIEKIRGEVSEAKMTENRGGRKVAKGKPTETKAKWIDRGRRINKLVGTGLETASGKQYGKFQDAIEAEQMLERGVDLNTIAEKLNIKAKDSLRKRINDKIAKNKKAVLEAKEAQDKAKLEAQSLFGTIEFIEEEMQKPEPNLDKIQIELSKLGSDLKGVNSLNGAEAALSILKQDARFYGMESMSSEDIKQRVKEFEQIKNRTFEDIKQEIEKRNQEYKELLDFVMGRVDPKEKSSRDPKKQARARKKKDTFFAHIGVRNFWAILDKMDMLSEDPMSGKLVDHFINVMRRGDIQHEKIMTDFHNDLNELQKRVFNTEKPMEVMKDLQIAPGRPKESLKERVSRAKGDELRVVAEDVEVKDNDGNVIDVLPLNQMIAAKKWLELQDPTLEDTFFSEFDKKTGTGMGYTTHHIRTIEEYLRDDVKEYASDIMNELLPKYYEVFNETYRKMNGVDLPKNEFYTPIFRIGEGEETIDPNVLINQQQRFKTVNNGHTVLRTANTKALKYVDLHKSIDSYLRKMAHYTAYAEPVKEVSKVFKHSPEVRGAVKQVHGTAIMNELDSFIDDLANNDRTKEWQWYDWLRRNYIFASLAGKTNQIFKQFMSVGAGVDYLGGQNFVQAFVDFAKNPQKNIKETMANPLLRRRLEQGNFDPDAAASLAQDWTKSNKRSSWKNMMMLPTKLGDIAPIAVLYPKYKAKALKEAKIEGYKGEEAEQRAETKATHEVLMWQQSTFTSDLSSVQRNRGIQRLLVMYATSPLSYHRKAVSGMRHMVQGVREGNRAKFIKGAQTAFVGWVVLPQLYTLALNGFRWDDDDQLQSLLIGNLNALPMTGEAIAHGFNQLFGKPFDFGITPLQSLIRYTENTFGAADNIYDAIFEEGKNMSAEEMWTALDDLGQAPAFATGMPWGLKGHIDGIRWVAQGNASSWHERVTRTLGWSEWQITPNKAVTRGIEREVMLSMMRDESPDQLLNRMVEEKGAKHVLENKHKYLREYAIRNFLDPTYTDELVTKLSQAESNEDKADILLNESKHYPKEEFIQMLGKMAIKIPIPYVDEDGQMKDREYTNLISDEVYMKVFSELQKRQN
jgi:hypothetical protein